MPERPASLPRHHISSSFPVTSMTSPTRKDKSSCSCPWKSYRASTRLGRDGPAPAVAPVPEADSDAYCFCSRAFSCSAVSYCAAPVDASEGCENGSAGRSSERAWYGLDDDTGSLNCLPPWALTGAFANLSEEQKEGTRKPMNNQKWTGNLACKLTHSQGGGQHTTQWGVHPDQMLFHYQSQAVEVPFSKRDYQPDLRIYQTAAGTAAAVSPAQRTG